MWLSLDRYRNPSRIRQFDARDFQWRPKEEDGSSQYLTAKSNTRNPPSLPPPTQYQLFPLVFCDFSKPAMTASPIFHDHEERKTKYSVSRTSTWGCFYSSRAVASLAESQHWRGGSARSFRSSQIMLDPLVDKIENIFCAHNRRHEER
jgi:hypothetical protein